jgi:LacI family transcriptional regulator
LGRAATAELLDGTQWPTALIAGGNQLLIGMLSELAARGLRAGSDISVVTCDDIALNELHDPPIAVIRRDTTALGNVAADLLLRRMNGAHRQGRLYCRPSSSSVRPSCAPPPQVATR